jgi:hypothetical protein
LHLELTVLHLLDMAILRFRAWAMGGIGCLALSTAGIATGCSDSDDPSTGDSSTALPMCAENGAPATSVLVAGPKECVATGFCPRKEFEGVVVSTGDGIPEETRDAIQYGWKSSETRWIKIDDANHIWTIATWNIPLEFREGSAVSGSYLSAPATSAPAESALELRVGGQLALYYGTAGEIGPGGVGTLMLPKDVEVERGAATCRSFGGCVTSWSEYELEISVNRGKPVTLGTNESKIQGDYALKNFRSALSAGSTCPDAFVADTTIFVARTASLYEEPDSDAGSGDDAGQR